MACTGNVYVEFGTGSAVATTSSILFPAGVEMFALPQDITHVAVLQVGASSGVFSVNRMK
jgi:ribosomal protein L11 methylase PrmA